MSKDRPSELSDYEVIGATLVAQEDELPLRLRPVVRSREEPHVYALIYGDDNEEVLRYEEIELVEEWMEQGQFYRAAFPFPARPGHWMIQFRANMPPEYLPVDQARERLIEEAQRALRDCASAVARGDIDAAISHAGYASRAHPEQPLARLALIALSRDRLAESQIWFEKLPLDELDRDSIKRAFRSAGSELRALKSRIESDPLAREYELLPRWLKKRRDSFGYRSFSLPSEPWGQAA